MTNIVICLWDIECEKAVPYSITSVGHGADPSFLTVSPQATLVVNPVVGCRYFRPGSVDRIKEYEQVHLVQSPDLDFNACST